MAVESQSPELFISLGVIETELRNARVLTAQREVVMEGLRASVVADQSTETSTVDKSALITRLNVQVSELMEERRRLAEEARILRTQRWTEYLADHETDDRVMDDIAEALEGILDRDTPLASLREPVIDMLVVKAVEAITYPQKGFDPFEEIWEKVTQKVVDTASKDTAEAREIRLQLIRVISKGFEEGNIDNEFTYKLIECLGLRRLNEDILREFFRLRALNLTSEEEIDLRRAMNYTFICWKFSQTPPEQSRMDLTS